VSSIREDPQNRRAVVLLDNALRGPGITPFIGAGLSIPAGYPGWTDFLLDLGRRGHVRVSTHLRRQQYEEAAELLLDRMGQTRLDREIRATYGRRRAPRGAVLYLPALARGAVVTTNFDGVLEEVFRAAGNPFQYPIWGGHPISAGGVVQQREHVLIKIHGDAKHPAGRVLTRREYQHHYANADTPVARALASILRIRPLLLLGCRVEKDRYLDLLRRTPLRRGWTHFAVLPLDGDAKWRKERRAYLRRFRITPLWYTAGNYGAIAEFLAELAQPASPARRPPAAAKRHLHSVRDLERELAAHAPADEKIDIFLDAEEVFARAGLSVEYQRIASRIYRLALRRERYCDALQIANHYASTARPNDRVFRAWMRRAERLAAHCADETILEDLALNQAQAAEERDPEKAIAIYRQLSRSRWDGLAAAALREWGLVEARTGSRARAKELFRRSINRAKRVPLHEGRTLRMLADLLADDDDIGEARDTYRQAISRFRLDGDLEGVASSLNGLGALELSQQQWRRAASQFRAALHYAQLVESSLIVSVVRSNLASSLYLRAMARSPRKLTRAEFLHAMREADEHLSDAIAQEPSSHERARLRTQRALLTAHLGPTSEALRELAHAARVLRRFPGDIWNWTNAFNRAIVLADDGQTRRAIRATRHAQKLAARLRYPFGIHRSRQFLESLNRTEGSLASLRRHALPHRRQPRARRSAHAG
jgi:tetratricopeptide (TPR) repeat protein